MTKPEAGSNQAVNDATIKCAKCRTENPPGSIVCLRCDEALHTKCDRCGTLNSRRRRHCTCCGHHLRSSLRHHWRKHKTRIIQTVVLLLIIIGLGSCLGWLVVHLGSEGAASAAESP
jgi:hypothetical protein